MEKLKKWLQESLDQQWIKITISNPRKKDGATKVVYRPVLLKGEMKIQEEVFQNNQVFHVNMGWKEKPQLCEKVCDFTKQFKQVEWETAEANFIALINKKGQASIKKRVKSEKTEASMETFAHNRKKKYILEEGKPISFLVELGVMNKDGYIVKAKYDKFRQINRFLEFVDDVEKELPKKKQLTVIDFGCGKSYLTFALYYYLKVVKQYQVHIIGLDLKEDVIERCNRLAQKLQYQSLEFLHGDIAQYQGVDHADMVVTLHACDTATDYALAKAVTWGAKVILSVPCCQHELNKTMKNGILGPLFQYGIIKERTAALFTDALRGQLLEQKGYQVQLLEFIDMEHTPKNILIRGVYRGESHTGDKEAYRRCVDFLNGDLTLEKLLK